MSLWLAEQHSSVTKAFNSRRANLNFHLAGSVFIWFTLLNKKISRKNTDFPGMFALWAIKLLFRMAPYMHSSVDLLWGEMEMPINTVSRMQSP